MAELTSSIITIANVSLVVIEKTVRYIKDINLVNDLIKDLLDRLKDLHRLIKVVASTYRQAGPGDNTRASRFVGNTLLTCQGRMDKLKPLICELAALDSETWLQKLTVKRRLDRVKNEIKTVIENIRMDMKSMSVGMSCWSLNVATAHRRISETMVAQQAINVRAELENPAYEDASPIKRTFSEAATVFGRDPDLQLRRVSTAVSSHSRPSISSTSSGALQALSDRSNSIASATGSVPLEYKSDWEDFHFRVTKCGGNKERIQKIRNILECHSDGSTLVRSTDTCKRTPLHRAAQHGDINLARILVKFGADINALDSEPSSVLDMAVAGRHCSFVAFLLDQGVDQSAVLPCNLAKFKEMKRIIQFERQAVVKKRHTLSQTALSDIVT